MTQSRPVTVKIRDTALSAGMTSRSSPPSSRARLCAPTRTPNPTESQNRVPVMSTTMMVCPWAAECSGTVRSCPAVMVSISAGDAEEIGGQKHPGTRPAYGPRRSLYPTRTPETLCSRPMVQVTGMTIRALRNRERAR